MAENINILNQRSVTVTKDIQTVSSEENQSYLAAHWDQLVISPNTRTIWHNGLPFGTAYQFAQNDASGDVFGDTLTHTISAKNGFAAGEHLKVVSDNAVAVGKYNHDELVDNKPGYSFMIGNGTSDESRSNAFCVTAGGGVFADGDFTAYQISNTKLDTSYVTSLGSAASMNVVLKALLTAPKYYSPTTSHFTNVNTTASMSWALVGQKFDNFNIQFVWNAYTGSGASAVRCRAAYEGSYIYDYIEKNNKFPDITVQVSSAASHKFGLQDLGYTECLIKDNTDNFSSDLSWPIKVATAANTSTGTLTTANVNIISPKLPVKDNTKAVQIYNGTNPYKFKFNSAAVAESYTVAGFTLPKAGIYKVINNQTMTIGYGAQQESFFAQLYENTPPVFVKGGSPSAGSLNIIWNYSVAAGYYMVYGLFQKSKVVEKMDNQSVLNAMDQQQGSGDSAITFNTSYIKYIKIGGNFNTVYLPTSSTEVYFGSNKIGAAKYSENGVKYFFVAFPQNNFNVTQKATGDWIHYKASTVASDAAIGNQTELKDVSWTHSTYTGGSAINYKVYVGMLNFDSLDFGTESKDQVNIHLTMNQTGLTTQYT